MKQLFYTNLSHIDILDENDRMRFEELQKKGHIGLTDEEYAELENLYRFCEETFLRKTQRCIELPS
ncbi:MAG: hypothetical protein IJP61_04285 [Treponema sp.]|nr:hypothetical protein [Treponema sp.]